MAFSLWRTEFWELCSSLVSTLWSLVRFGMWLFPVGDARPHYFHFGEAILAPGGRFGALTGWLGLWISFVSFVGPVVATPLVLLCFFSEGLFALVVALGFWVGFVWTLLLVGPWIPVIWGLAWYWVLEERWFRCSRPLPDLLVEDLPCADVRRLAGVPVAVGDGVAGGRYRCGVPCVACDSRVDFELGTARMEMEGEAHLSVSQAAFAAGRLRPRARWVRALEAVLGGPTGSVGRLVRGRWVPDLPSSRRSPVANGLITSLSGGARLLGGGVVQHPEAGRPNASQVWYLLELPDGEQVVCFPELLARLQAYSVFRDRDASLLSALTARARDWCKLELPAWAWAHALASSVALAFDASVQEDQAGRLIAKCTSPGNPLSVVTTL